MLKINDQLFIPTEEIEWQAIRSQGAGGQNVNKVASAIHMRFDVSASSLPEPVKTRLLAIHDNRLTKEGVIVIKAQQFRTQEKNLEAAFSRLTDIIKTAAFVPKARRATKPSRGSVKRRLDSKTKRSKVKRGRGKIDYD